MAGGKGTRLSSYTKDIPKPMVEINNKPILQYQIENFISYGIKDIILIIGYLGEKIIDYFGDGKKFGVDIEYFTEDTPLGTAGALYFLRDKLQGDFILVFGDILFDIDINRFYDFHKMKFSIATLFVHPNSHPFDSDIIILDSNSRVIGIDSKNNTRNYYYSNCVNSGLYFFNYAVLEYIQEPKKLDLEKDIISNIIKDRNNIYGYISPEYVKDMGTYERLEKVTEDVNNSTVKSKNLAYEQKCIFLDRDGTVNKYKGLLYDMDEFELEADAAEAIKEINSSGYLCILITNQPVVARNLCTIEDIERIHKKMETLLGEQGAYLDDIVYCPHHPDHGYEGENKDYKIECNCRKPKIGMIENCVKKFNIDLSKSFIIGDTTIDIMTGINAGLKTILLRTGEAGNDKKFDVKADYAFNTLKEAVSAIKGAFL